jgi:hypothetical protein
MDWNVWDQEDLDAGQAWKASGGLPAGMVSSYPDNIPSGTSPTYSNGFSLADFTGALQSVAGSVTNAAKSIYELENTANTLTLKRLQTSAAIDVTKAQTAAARDVALAESMTATAKAQATLNAAKQSAQLQSSLGLSTTDLLILGGLAFLVVKLMGRGK